MFPLFLFSRLSVQGLHCSRVLNWFWLTCYAMLPKNIHYGIFYYSSLQLAAYTAYNIHCVKSVRIRSFFWSVLFPHLDWIRKDTSYLSVFSPNAGKYGPEKTPYLDTFHAVILQKIANLMVRHLTWRRFLCWLNLPVGKRFFPTTLPYYRGGVAI